MTTPTDKEISKCLQKHGGNQTKAAEELGVSRWRVWKYVKDLGEEQIDDSVRQTRGYEKKISDLENKLKDERRRREVAEDDLHRMLERDSVLSEVQEKETVSRSLASLSGGGSCTAIICANDWHLEKQIKPSTVSGLNEFNLDIAQERIDRLWQKSVYLIDFYGNIGDVDDVILWLGGDMLNNYLHESDVESNFCGPAEAVCLIQEHIATGIDHLLSRTNLRLVVCNYGNHARTTKTNRPATGWKTSWEYLAYCNLSKIFDQLDWRIPQGYFNYVDVHGFKVRFHHGESVKYYGGVGGLTVPMNKSIAQWDKSIRADLSINGHFHQYFDSWSWVSSGCLCGYDAYAQSIKAEYQEPTQTVVFLDKERGKTLSIPIFVT